MMHQVPHHGLASLPPELLLNIFHHLDTTHDAFTLSKVSKLARLLWTTHEATILDAIQRKTVTSYHDARSMALAMQYVLTRDAQSQAAGGGGPLRSKKAGMTTSRSTQYLIHQNARNVEILCDYWLGIVSKDLSESRRRFSPHRNPAYLTQTERERFAHACYRVWEFVAFSSLADKPEAAHRQAAVLDVGIAEHWLLYEVCLFFTFHSKNAAWRRFDGLPCYGPDLHKPQEFAKISEAYRHKLQAAGHSGMIASHEDCPMGLYMALFDDHQRRLHTMASDIYNGHRTDD